MSLFKKWNLNYKKIFIQWINLSKLFHTISDYLEKLFKNDRYFISNLLKFYAFKKCFIENWVKFRAKLTHLNLNLQMIVSQYLYEQRF